MKEMFALYFFIIIGGKLGTEMVRTWYGVDTDLVRSKQILNY